MEFCRVVLAAAVSVRGGEVQGQGAHELDGTGLSRAGTVMGGTFSGAKPPAMVASRRLDVRGDFVQL